VRKCDHNTSMKYLSNFKKIVNICIKNGWLDRNPFAGFKMTKREVERPFLVEEELNRIIAKTFLMPRMNQVRDIFIFCCYTGLAYVDVEKLTREEITTALTVKNGSGPVGRKQIQLHACLCFHLRWKFWTGTRMIRSVHKKRLLPVLSNQKMNTYLKEIATLVKSRKR
jgi:hypothetical protein